MKREPDDINFGVLQVGRNDRYEVVVNRLPKGHIVFSPRQARHFARLLMKHAAEALQEWRAAHKS